MLTDSRTEQNSAETLMNVTAVQDERNGQCGTARMHLLTCSTMWMLGFNLSAALFNA